MLCEIWLPQRKITESVSISMAQTKAVSLSTYSSVKVLKFSEVQDRDYTVLLPVFSLFWGIKILLIPGRVSCREEKERTERKRDKNEKGKKKKETRTKIKLKNHNPILREQQMNPAGGVRGTVILSHQGGISCVCGSSSRGKKDVFAKGF